MLLFRTEATIYSEITQTMKNAARQLNISACIQEWRAKAARRPSEIGGGGGAALLAQRSNTHTHRSEVA